MRPMRLEEYQTGQRVMCLTKWPGTVLGTRKLPSGYWRVYVMPDDITQCAGTEPDPELGICLTFELAESLSPLGEVGPPTSLPPLGPGDLVVLGRHTDKEQPGWVMGMEPFVGKAALLKELWSGSTDRRRVWLVTALNPEESGMDRYYWLEKDMIRVGAPISTGVETVSKDTSAALANTQAQLVATQQAYKGLTELLNNLKKGTIPYANVVAVGKERVVINYRGTQIECLPVKGVKAGDVVRISPETSQIIDVAEDAPAAGEVVVVSRVPPTVGGKNPICEIDRNGASRAVTYSGKVEEGDRVVLDGSGSVVIANLGKLESEQAFNQATGVTWEDIGGLEEAKREMQEAIEAPVKFKDLYSKYGKQQVKGVLLFGAPGCGKTMLGKAAATAHAKVHGAKSGAGAFFYVKGPELLDMYVGNTERKIRELFQAARIHKKKAGYPAIIFIDEADAILGKRGSQHGTVLSSTLVPQFLAEMDGLVESGALVLLSTNRADTLDPAIVRDGRIDRRIKVTRPAKKEAADILSKYLGKLPAALEVKAASEYAADRIYDPELALYHIHKKGGELEPFTLGHITSGAMLAGVVDRASSLAIRREVEGGHGRLMKEDLAHAAKLTHSQAMGMNYEDDLEEFCRGWEDEVGRIVKAA